MSVKILKEKWKTHFCNSNIIIQQFDISLHENVQKIIKTLHTYFLSLLFWYIWRVSHWIYNELSSSLTFDCAAVLLCTKSLLSVFFLIHHVYVKILLIENIFGDKLSLKGDKILSSRFLSLSSWNIIHQSTFKNLIMCTYASSRMPRFRRNSH